MAVDLPDWDVRVADADDAGAIATLRSLGSSGVADRDFERRVAAWVIAGFRTTWLAIVDGSAVGMASVLEYQRMPRPGRPDSSWGYLGNLFVREEHRNRGIGSALIATVIVAADERGYVRLVVSPSSRALPLFQSAGFVAPDEPMDAIACSCAPLVDAELVIVCSVASARPRRGTSRAKQHCRSSEPDLAFGAVVAGSAPSDARVCGS